jgi:ribose transport system substrate-binding protein
MNMHGHGRLIGGAVLVVGVLALAACGGSSKSSSSSTTTGAAAAGTTSSSGGTYTLGVSNTLVGNGWREEMICSVKAQAAASGQVGKVIVADRNGGPADQAADMRNLISSGVNAIIADPSSPSALNGVISQAASRGIKVIAVDQAVSAPQAYNVTNDQVAYGRLGAEWLFKQLHGKGNVVEMRGIAGAPADIDRHKGFMQALKNYPGIHVVKQTFTGWQYATGGKQMLDILNSGVKVDGVWTSGIDYTVVNAFKTAGKPYVPVVGADNNKFLSQIINLHGKGFVGAAVTNPATVGGVGAAVAVKVLNGDNVSKTVKLTPEVWDYSHDLSTIKKYYRASAPPTYSDLLEVKPWTTYTPSQLRSCTGP